LVLKDFLNYLGLVNKADDAPLPLAFKAGKEAIYAENPSAAGVAGPEDNVRDAEFKEKPDEETK